MTARLADISDCPSWPRHLSAEQAAAYVGVSVNLFLEEVEAGRWARPEKRGSKGGRLTWDRILLDRASDTRSGIASADRGNAEQDALSRLGG